MRSNLLGIKLFGIRSGQYPVRYARLLGISVLISFLGSLPPGTTNLLTIRLAGVGGPTVAFLFAIGCMMAEVVYVAASVFLMDRLLRFSVIFKLLQWVSATVLLAFGIASFLTAANGFPSHVLPEGNNSSPLIFGFLLMIINPVQIPFWMSWTTVLIQRGVLKVEGRYYLLYACGAGIGSILASICFIMLGQIITPQLLPPAIFHGILGLFFVVAGIVQIRKIFERRGARGRMTNLAG